MPKQLYVLISTINNRIVNINNIIQSVNKNIVYVVSHQINVPVSKQTQLYITELMSRKDVHYSILQNIGVAKNRNNALRFVQPDSLSLILDDDVLLYKDTFNTVFEAFKKNPSADFISFKILNTDGYDFKRYPKEKVQHTLSTLTGIGTTEIAFRNNLVLKNKITFDERFGPGSDIYSIGEDFIFTMDLYCKKTNMLFIPTPIVTHPTLSSGSKIDRKTVFGRGAMFARVFGWKAFLINILFSLKKYSSYRNQLSFFSYLTNLNKGTIHYFKSWDKRVSC